MHIPVFFIDSPSLFWREILEIIFKNSTNVGIFVTEIRFAKTHYFFAKREYSGSDFSLFVLFTTTEFFIHFYLLD